MKEAETRQNLNTPPGGVGRCAVGAVAVGRLGGVWNTRQGVGTARAGKGGLRP
jgi:hypothetical protein